MKRAHIHIDWWLILPVAVLLLLGLVTLFSLGQGFFRSQLVSLFLAIAAFVFFSQLDFRSLRYFALPIYVVSCLILLHILFIGFESKGAVRWIEVFGVSLQFSEILKPFLLISLASFLSRSDSYSLRTFLLSFVLAMPLVFFIFRQPDLGNALIYLSVVLGTLFISGYPILWFVALFIPFIVISPFLWSKLHDYQRLRVITFLNPTADPQGTSYNAIQAVIAVGSGMLLGRGAQEGTQAGLLFLPEKHTDFIFATIAESFGFLGASAIITAFLFLLYRIISIMRSTDDRFAQLFSLGALLLLFIHFFVNIGMNIAVAPIVGVTLPFVSFGGSSLLSNSILLGIVSSISAVYRRRETLEIH